MRLQEINTGWYRLNTVEVDIGAGLVRVGDENRRLEPRLCGVLALLIQRGGEAVTRDEFLETAWDEDGSDEALTQAISRLRQILGDRGLIRTLPRIGYQLSIRPETLSEAPAAPAATNSADRPPAPAAPAIIAIPRSYLFGVATGAILLAGLVTIALLIASSTGMMRGDIELEIVEGEDVEFHRIPDEG